MGLNLFFSKSNYDKSVSAFSHLKTDSTSPPKVIKKIIKNLPNPRPDNYKILKSLRVNNYLIIKIKYLDCTNYEGVKILVFENCTLKKLKIQKLIDPHFSENKKFKSPIARFEPTVKGWDLALKLCKL